MTLEPLRVNIPASNGKAALLTSAAPTEQRRKRPKNAPRHVAIIMDGNGRWARRRLLPRAAGHRAGVESLTLYAFSTENWARPTEEVDTLMRLFLETAKERVPELGEKGVRIRFVGRREKLPEEIQSSMREAEELTKSNDKLDVYIALNYGGRSEIVDAAKRMMLAGLDPEEVDEATFSKYLYAPEVPEIDLVIRTSGELRVSNFLLWQIAYAELYVTDTLWPDFSKDEFAKAIKSFTTRSRRRGGV